MIFVHARIRSSMFLCVVNDIWLDFMLSSSNDY